MAFTLTPTGTARTRGDGTPTLNTYVLDEFQQCLEDDLDQVFIQSDGGDFATNQNSVQYTHATGEVANYPAIFDNPTEEVNINTSSPFNETKPQIRLQESKLLRPIKKKDRVLFRGKPYFVEDKISDGVGVTTIYLRQN